jgi:hypothetical protein
MWVAARGLQEALDAVRNWLMTKWLSGQVEGQNNRLETLKRDMYGRVSVKKNLCKTTSPATLLRAHKSRQNRLLRNAANAAPPIRFHSL